MAVTSVSGSLDVPEINEEVCVNHSDGIHIGLLDSCTHYYYCEAGIGYLQDCTTFGQLSYDPSIGGCRQASEVDCTARVFGDPYDRPPLKSQPHEKIYVHAPDYETHVCFEYEDGVTLGIEGSCSLYYYCHDGVGYIYNCKESGDKLYNPNTAECEAKELFECDESKDVIMYPYAH